MPDVPFEKKDFAALVNNLLLQVKSSSGGRTPLTDANEGSVVRTLMEAFARELAVCYEQLDMVYQNAYMDTAAGAALDNVVALLGVQRRTGDRLEGMVTFSRNQPAPEDIHIPEGTLIAGRDAPLFATVENAVLHKQEKQVSVGVRAVEPGGDKVTAGRLTVMPRPIAGIELATNSSELILRQREETDDELRERVRYMMRHANTGTVSALEQAARSLGIAEVKIIEDLQGAPGVIELVIGDADVSPELVEQVAQRAEEVRPAGIRLKVTGATRVWVQVTATLELSADLADHEKNDIKSKVIADLESYFSKLKVGESVRAVKVRNILTSHDEVVAWHLTPGFHFLDPYVMEQDSLTPMRSKYLMANDDVLIGSSDRAGLDLAALPIRLGFEPPKTKAWVDVTVTLKAYADGATEQSLKEKIGVALKNHFESIVTDIAPGATAGITYEALQNKISNALYGQSISGMRFTIIHERDGRAVELDMPQSNDQIGEREQPQVRNVTLKS